MSEIFNNTILLTTTLSILFNFHKLCKNVRVRIWVCECECLYVFVGVYSYMEFHSSALYNYHHWKLWNSFIMTMEYPFATLCCTIYINSHCSLEITRGFFISTDLSFLDFYKWKENMKLFCGKINIKLTILTIFKWY